MKFLNYLFLVLSVGLVSTAFAQPANDACSDAESLTLASSPATASFVPGTTVDADTSAAHHANHPEVCSATWYKDDVWYTFTTPATITDETYITVKTKFGANSTDILSVGMTVYNSCDTSAPMIAECFSGGKDSLIINSIDITPNTTYLVRLWSGESPNANSGTFEIAVYLDQYPTDTSSIYYYGFENGFDGWTNYGIGDSTVLNTGEHKWVYSSNSIYRGPYTSALLESSTSFSGCAVFPAGIYNRNASGNPPYPIIAGALESPVLDVSAYPAVEVEFYQFARVLNGSNSASGDIPRSGRGCVLQYSVDGGTTWESTVYQVNDDIENNADTEGLKTYFLPGAGGSSNLKIRFAFNGQFYVWMIDDVRVKGSANYNLEVATDYYGSAYNYLTPVSQVEPIFFGVDANVKSGATMNNVTATLDIESAGTQVFSSADNFGTWTSDSSYRVEFFLPDSFTAAGVAGDMFTGVYTISSDSADPTPQDNSINIEFGLSDFEFRKDNGTQTTAYSLSTNGYTDYYELATSYYCATDVTAKAINFTLGDAPSDVTYTLTVYEVPPSALPTSLDVDFNLGRADIDIVAEEIIDDNSYVTADDLIQVMLTDEPILQAGYTYIVAITLDQSNASNTARLAYTSDIIKDRAVYYDRLQRGLEARLPAAMVAADGGDFELFGWDIQPHLRLMIDPFVSTKNSQIDANLSVFPNPATDVIKASVNFENNQNEVTYTISDMTGKTVYFNTISNVTSNSSEINVTNLPAGIYNFTVETAKGVQTTQFVKK